MNVVDKILEGEDIRNVLEAKKLAIMKAHYISKDKVSIDDILKKTKGSFIIMAALLLNDDPAWLITYSSEKPFISKKTVVPYVVDTGTGHGEENYAEIQGVFMVDADHNITPVFGEKFLKQKRKAWVLK